MHGLAPDGRPYHASDPRLLEWVHIAEVESFLLAYQMYGAAPFDQAGRDGYVADMAVVATALGVPDPPRTEKEVHDRIHAYRPELRGTAAARDAARFLLLTPPLALPARPVYGLLAATAVAMLPRWARLPLLLPYAPPLEATVTRMAGRVLVGSIRWVMTPGSHQGVDQPHQNDAAMIP